MWDVFSAAKGIVPILFHTNNEEKSAFVTSVYTRLYNFRVHFPLNLTVNTSGLLHEP